MPRRLRARRATWRGKHVTYGAEFSWSTRASAAQPDPALQEYLGLTTNDQTCHHARHRESLELNTKTRRLLPTPLNLMVGVLSLAFLSACGSEMNRHIQGMDSAEKKFNETQSQRVVAFMSLETMFPDPRTRALAKAAGKGNIKEIDQLVKDGVSVNARGTQGATPLFWAMRNYKGFKRLLELGADPNVVYADGNNVMVAAAQLKDRRILQTALEHAGNPNLAAGDSSGSTPIFYAMNADIDMVDLLLKHGADINAKDSFDSSPVLTAAKVLNFEMVYYLLERGADYRLKDRNGYDLAKQVATKVGKIRSETKWAKWQEKVIEWLQAKGVEIPASPQRRQ